MRILTEPLEGGKRLGDKGRSAAGDAQATGADVFWHGEIRADYILRQMTDALQILVRFGGQADHEIELDRAPAAFKGVSHGTHQVVLSNTLVDYVAQALRAGFGSQRQAGFADLLRLLK